MREETVEGKKLIKKAEKPKVFVISLHKTGTTSVMCFLEGLGYTVTVAEPQLVYEAVNQKFENIDVFLDKYDAFQDDPWYILYPYVYRKFPDAKFIFLERQEEEWINSIQSFYGRDRFNNKVRKLFYGSADTISNKQMYLRKYREHRDEVFSFFKENPNFISIMVSNNEDAVRLQSFLGKRTKFQKFPHLNRQNSNDREKYQKRIKFFLLSPGLKDQLKIIIIKILKWKNFIKIRNSIRFFKSKLRVIRKSF